MSGRRAPNGEARADPATVLRFEDVDIVFGSRPRLALPLIDAGRTRAEIDAETGQIVGVSGASLSVREGEIVVLMGLSGSGKSTLLRAVNGLAPVVRGRALVRDGDAMTDPKACRPAALRHLRRSLVAMVFQQFALLPWRTVADNVGFGLELAGVPKAERRTRSLAQLDLVGLTDWADRPVASLSGGMQQRVGFARALATEAPILLMDEPFSALDPIVRSKLQDDLLALQGELRRTILFVSHDLEEAFKLGDRIAIMEGGRIVQVGTPTEIARNPASAYVADFVSHMNPLGVLTAADVMRPPGDGLTLAMAGSASPSTPVAAIIKALSGRDGAVAVIERGAIVGTISARDVVSALAGGGAPAGRHSRPDSAPPTEARAAGAGGPPAAPPPA